MSKDLVDKLNQLLSDPKSEGIDHLEVLHEIYIQYSFGWRIMFPLVQFYSEHLNGIPFLSEKVNWEQEKFTEYRERYLDVYSDVKQLVEDAILKLESKSEVVLK